MWCVRACSRCTKGLGLQGAGARRTECRSLGRLRAVAPPRTSIPVLPSSARSDTFLGRSLSPLRYCFNGIVRPTLPEGVGAAAGLRAAASPHTPPTPLPCRTRFDALPLTRTPQGVAAGGLLGYGIGSIKGALVSWKYEYVRHLRMLRARDES